jgi:hypothetical protein
LNGEGEGVAGRPAGMEEDRVWKGVVWRTQKQRRLTGVDESGVEASGQ